MISNKKHIQQLASLLLKKGITDIVISPGSRNAPLIITFSGTKDFNCYNIVDERSASYFAIGLAQAKNKPVAIVCTSGTAALNYTPAIAEAFYLKVPLIALTADRPRHLIDQADGQTVRQENVFANHSLYNLNMPETEKEEDISLANREINNCMNIAIQQKGPVHINIPMDEPLYETQEQELPEFRSIDLLPDHSTLPQLELKTLANLWNKSDRVLILPGQCAPNQNLKKILIELGKKDNIVILSEHISNLNEAEFCSGIDNILIQQNEESNEDFKFDLLITFGGQLVSKRVKQFLRTKPHKEHWHISETNEHIDTFFSLTRVLPIKPFAFFESIAPLIKNGQNNFNWKEKENKAWELQDKYVQDISFCDFKAFRIINEQLPDKSVLHLGNSTSVRYMQLLKPNRTISYQGNRGTSGIDGIISTASGYASASDQINTIILGELSFLYDSNALWNKHLPNNLRIIVTNNNGGNIFSLINGPTKSEVFKHHFIANQNVELEGIAKAFGIEFISTQNEMELQRALKYAYNSEEIERKNRPIIIEIKTDIDLNTKLFKGYFNHLKTH